MIFCCFPGSLTLWPNIPAVWQVRDCRLRSYPPLPKLMREKKFRKPLRPLFAISCVMPSCNYYLILIIGIHSQPFPAFLIYPKLGGG